MWWLKIINLIFELKDAYLQLSVCKHEDNLINKLEMLRSSVYDEFLED